MKLNWSILLFVFVSNTNNLIAQCLNVSNLNYSVVNTNPCDFPKTFEFTSSVNIDTTPVFLSSQSSFANFQLPFDLDFPNQANGCMYLLNIDGSYTAWGNNERYDAYCKYNSNNNTLISAGGGLGDDLSPSPVQLPTAYDTAHSYNYFFNGDGNLVTYKFRDNNYFDNDGSADFIWYVIPCYEFFWDFGDGNNSTLINPTHTYNKAGSYSVSLTVTDILNNCTVTYDSNLVVLPAPIADLGDDKVLCPPQQLILNPGVFSSYNWQDGSNTRLFAVTKPGTYWVNITDAQGCTSSDTVRVEESCFGKVLLPTAFTPNNDGLNDVFKAVSIRTKLTKINLYIFDRRGNLLFETNDINTGWDGTFEGKLVQNGTYIYKISYSGVLDNEIFNKKESGSFIVVR